MFDFAWSELGLIAVVSVLVMGPKQLPETMRTLAKVMRKVRSLGAEFQGHVNEMIREAELEDLRSQVQKLSTTNVSAEVAKMVDPSGEVAAALNPELPAPAEPTPEAAPAEASAEAPKLSPTDEPAPATTHLVPDPA